MSLFRKRRKTPSSSSDPTDEGTPGTYTDLNKVRFVYLCENWVVELHVWWVILPSLNGADGLFNTRTKSIV